MKAMTAKLSTRGQVVLPKEVRERLDLKEGDTLFVEVEDSSIRLIPLPRDFAKRTRGLGQEMWQKVGGGEAYLKRERESWDTPH